MVYTNSRDTMIWWDPQTKKLKYCSYENFNEHNNTFEKIWSHGSALMNGTNISAPPTIKWIFYTTASTKMIYLRQQ